MSKTLSTDSLTIVTTERTWRTNIESPLGADYVLTAHREVVRAADDVIISRDQNAGVVSRALSGVAGEVYTCADGTEISVVHLAEALAGFIERWRDEDEAPVVDPEA